MFLLGFYLTEDQRDNNDAEKFGGGGVVVGGLLKNLVGAEKFGVGS